MSIGATRMTSAYRQLPAVETLVQAIQRRANGDAQPRELLVDAARAELDAARAAIAGGAAAPSIEHLIGATLARSRGIAQPSLRPLINATGVIIQTNLGRAPLSAAALSAMREVGLGYSNLEYDLDAGERGSRAAHLTGLLCQLTGAEAALAVNNNAAAIYLALSALAAGREVIISRGQAVEIGGGFRIPDVLRQSGATLVEIGTTNRTYTRDYAGAIGPQTALLMRIHTSNFKLTGFVHETSLRDMAEVAHAHNLAVLDDLGSGTLLPTAPYGLAPEPTVQESVAAGADLVTFSGDKLLGGPQAGCIVGRADLIAKLRAHPLARAVRIDKLQTAALEATLALYATGAHADVPVHRMIHESLDAVAQRAHTLAEAIGGDLEHAHVVHCSSVVGGGSVPGQALDSWGVRIQVPDPNAFAGRLRNGSPSVFCRTDDDHVLLDARTITDDQVRHVARAVLYAIEGDDLDDED